MSRRIGYVDMNHQVRNSNVSANPTNDTSDDLLRELANETGMARRQELLKAIWRLNRPVARPVSPPATRPESGTVTPEAQIRNPRIVQELGRRRKARTDSPIATATHQNTQNRNRGHMSDKQTLAALNELYATERFSLANYLRCAKPWVAPTDQCLAEAIWRVSDQQLEFAERVGAFIIERRGHVEGSSFPLRFTAFNDLSLDFLAPRVLEDQERIVRQIDEVARQLRGDAVACELVNEILGAEQAHLDNLRQLLDSPKSENCHMSVGSGLSNRSCQDPTHNVVTAA